MDPQHLRRLLEDVAAGATPVDGALSELKSLPFADHAEVKIDHHRALRCGFAEVVLCESKSAGQVRSAARELLEHGDVLLGTRATPSHYQAVAQVASDARFFEQAHLVVVDRREERPQLGHIVVVTGGTADVPVAEEAAISAEVMGNRVTRVYDVGVAGVHRLLAHQDVLGDARAIIAVAGMEGALPSLVTGLVSVPVIAVPTSVGYGVSLSGIAALLAMLNSCASGMAVVNIDNGFGAAAMASRINLGAQGDTA
ncbi:MAG: nickel pincer cofactor biosynthesis protein LarB [Anaerosomatales bacterium]|nr:nickel pincer cofactor biosynthesis protein LarB [Anaerosomatales bacterium]MDT8433621.1 nickel pincer cofactor biosynthesis protein LarB [Anaerosomatales bacterium]